MNTTKYLIALILMLCVLSCKDGTRKETTPETAMNPLDRLPDTEAGEIVRKAIEHTGGMDEWQKKKTLGYTKIFKFYDSTGTQLRELRQLHEYQLQPGLKMRISWEEDGNRFAVVNNGSQAWKLKNGEVMTGEDDKNSAWNSSFGSHYVATMPFKLTDLGTNLEYMGLDTLSSGRVVHNVKTTYDKGAGSSGGFHTWWYFFDKDSYGQAANFLDFGGGYSYVVNESFTEVDGIIMNRERKSYKTNAQREPQYLTTAYLYEDYVFDKVLEDDYFEIDE